MTLSDAVNATPHWEAVWALLDAAGGVGPPAAVLARIKEHMRLVRTWNARAGLAAASETDHLWVRHVLDSLSVGPYLPAGRVLDIGSGGGYPAVPLAVVFPDREFILLERVGRKVGFLRRVVAALEMENVALIQGSFPEVALPAPTAVTARAVERPDQFVKRLAAWMPADAVFLCQTPQEDALLANWFHVEHIDDAWATEGWRRGRLRALTPKK